MSDPATLLGLVIVALVGYGIGSISSGYLVGKIYRNVDLRTVGSGSTGATNTFRYAIVAQDCQPQVSAVTATSTINVPVIP